MPGIRNVILLLLLIAGTAIAADDDRPRARDVGLVIGTFPTGEFNAITDVAGVKVGHSTIIEGDDIRTGVTAIIPGPGNLYTHPIPANSSVKRRFVNLVKSKRQYC
jgi:D-aminopeptidase